MLDKELGKDLVKGGWDMTAGINKNGLLAGKVAVITGASRGIGDAIARRFAMEGCLLYTSDAADE